MFMNKKTDEAYMESSALDVRSLKRPLSSTAKLYISACNHAAATRALLFLSVLLSAQVA